MIKEVEVKNARHIFHLKQNLWKCFCSCYRDLRKCFLRNYEIIGIKLEKESSDKVIFTEAEETTEATSKRYGIGPGASGKVLTIINFSLKTEEYKKCIGNAKR